ncbi:type I DNA topoisomerase [Candidatus Dojkabacteria bacterium]|uniref:DNA topoisomerase 1 n=1 Tax=Candidatus Dojkabacteria bacterium TaxID=2099670 RepID=A0A847VDQ4_9BACT|nr:type I DNA topoisomerase [Candidatus Dojkabacteria bacterium]
MSKNSSYKNLLIVESPAKAKTINRYLGSDYKVVATVGHVIDLPKSQLGVDVDNGYEPEFEVIYGKGKVLKDLKKALPKDGNTYLAMDPDREGEAIAWHIKEHLKIKGAKRVSFHEITKEAIEEAIKKPTSIDEHLVEAQKARRVLDRLFGYKLSQLLWEKIWYGLSAGRVQSVALRLVVEREEEREKFKPEEYWEFFVHVQREKEELRIKLIKRDGKKYVPNSEKEINSIKKILGESKYKVVDIVKKEIKRNPYPPYTTSTLQQSGNNVLGYSAKRTMALAQSLYQSGYITYMRTDSVFLSEKAIKSIRKIIPEKYGKEYLPASPKYYKNRSKNVQEAHEAIRPSDFSLTYKEIKTKVGTPEAKLYDLIWKRAVSSQMEQKRVENLTIYLEPEGELPNIYTFSVGAQKTLFDGFRVVYGKEKDSDELLQEISGVKKDDIFKKKKFETEQKFTQPPSRYTEATLVKKLESLGIGRPSTYASTIATILQRSYVLKESRFLLPTDIGRVVTHLLKEKFSDLVDYEYTANVENRLDKIANGKLEYIPFLDREYKPLMKNIQKAMKEVSKEDVVILSKSDKKCPECGSGMVVRLGRYGKFLSCSRFPDCKGMKDLEGGQDSLDYKKYLKVEKCPECGSKMILKNSKYGLFWACERYPDCKGTQPLLLKEECPECGKHLVERRSKWGKSFIGCSGYPNCKYIKKEKKKD